MKNYKEAYKHGQKNRSRSTISRNEKLAIDRAYKTGENYSFPVDYLNMDEQYAARINLFSAEMEKNRENAFSENEKSATKWSDYSSLIAAPLGGEMMLSCNVVSGQKGAVRYYFDDFDKQNMLPDATTRFPYSDDAHTAAKRIQVTIGRYCLLRHNCATRIQRIYRVYIIRKSYMSHLQDFRSASRVIQCFYRFRVERLRKKRAIRVTACAAAMMIQSIVRRRRAMQKLRILREYRKLFLCAKLVSWVRACLKRKRKFRGVARRKYLHATRVQRVFRGRQCRALIRKMHSAQIFIRCAWRKHWKRKYAPLALRLLHALRRAIIYRKARRIQCLIRGFLGRRRAVRVRLQIIADHWSRSMLEFEVIRKAIAAFSIYDFSWYEPPSSDPDAAAANNNNNSSNRSINKTISTNAADKQKGKNSTNEKEEGNRNSTETMAKQITQLDILTRLILSNQLISSKSSRLSADSTIADAHALTRNQKLTLAILTAFSNRPDGLIDAVALQAAHQFLRLVRDDVYYWVPLCCPTDVAEYMEVGTGSLPHDENNELELDLMSIPSSVLTRAMQFMPTKAKLLESFGYGQEWMRSLLSGMSKKAALPNGEVPIGFIKTAGVGTRQARFLGKTMSSKIYHSMKSIIPSQAYSKITNGLTRVWQKFPQESLKLLQFLHSKVSLFLPESIRRLKPLKSAPLAVEDDLLHLENISSQNCNPDERKDRVDNLDIISRNGNDLNLELSPEPSPLRNDNSQSNSPSIGRSVISAARMAKRRRMSGLPDSPMQKPGSSIDFGFLDGRSLISGLSEEVEGSTVSHEISKQPIECVVSEDNDSVSMLSQQQSLLALENAHTSSSSSDHHVKLTYDEMDELWMQLLTGEVQRLHQKLGRNNPPPGPRKKESILQKASHHQKQLQAPSLFCIHSLVVMNVVTCRHRALKLRAMMTGRLPDTLLLKAILVRRWTKALYTVGLNASYKFRYEMPSANVSLDFVQRSPKECIHGHKLVETSENSTTVAPVRIGQPPRRSCGRCGEPLCVVPLNKHCGIEDRLGDNDDVDERNNKTVEIVRHCTDHCFRGGSIGWIPRSCLQPAVTSLLLRCDAVKRPRNHLDSHSAIKLFRTQPVASLPRIGSENEQSQLESVSEHNSNNNKSGVNSNSNTNNNKKMGKGKLNENRSVGDVEGDDNEENSDEFTNLQPVGLIEDYCSVHLDPSINFENEKLTDYFNNSYQSPSKEKKKLSKIVEKDKKPKSKKSSKGADKNVPSSPAANSNVKKPEKGKRKSPK